MLSELDFQFSVIALSETRITNVKEIVKLKIFKCSFFENWSAVMESNFPKLERRI